MTDTTKEDLKRINKELREKLKQFKDLEKAVTATAQDLTQSAIGVSKDQKGNFTLVHLKYDVEKNAAVIEKVEALDTADFAIAAHKARGTLVEKILRKARGDKYAE